MITADLLLGVLTKKEFNQANLDFFLVPTLGVTLTLFGYYVVPYLIRRLKEHRANEKFKEQEYLDQRTKTVSELHRLEGIGELFTDFLAGGCKWSEKYENSDLRVATFNEIRAGLLLDVRKTLDRDLTINNRRKLLKDLKGAWDAIPFFEVLKNEDKKTELNDDMRNDEAQNILDTFVALCEPGLKFGGPGWESVYQKIVVKRLLVGIPSDS